MDEDNSDVAVKPPISTVERWGDFMSDTKTSCCFICGTIDKVAPQNETLRRALSNFHHMFQYNVHDHRSKEKVFSILEGAVYCNSCANEFFRMQKLCAEIEHLYFQVSTTIMVCKNKLQNCGNFSKDELIRGREQLLQYIDRNPVIYTYKEDHFIEPMVICVEENAETVSSNPGASQESNDLSREHHLSSASESEFSDANSPEVSDSDSEEYSPKASTRKRPVKPKREPPSPCDTSTISDEASSSANVKLKKAVVRLERIQVPPKSLKKRGRKRKIGQDRKIEKVKRKHQLRPKKNEKGMFLCPHCSSELPRRNNLRLHIIKFHPDRLPSEKHIPCKVEGCNEMFQNAVNRDFHIRRSHPDYKPFQCQFCPSAFASRQSQRFHENNMHTRATPFECKVCDAKFTHYNKRERHMRNAHKELKQKNIQCDECGKSFFTLHEFRHHANVHNRPFVCDFCGKTFTAIVYLREHLPLHPESNMAMPLCKFCGKVFKSAHYLRIHEGIHEGNYRHKCDKCDYGTNIKSRMTEHLLTHQTDYECNLCGSLQFASLTEYRVHNRKVHNKKAFECSVCNKSFSFRQNWKRHVQSHANEETDNARDAILIPTSASSSQAETSGYLYSNFSS